MFRDYNQVIDNLEAVDRDLNLVNTTLTDCTITTSAAATFSGVVSKVTSGGAFGVYEAAFELKLGATTGGSTTITTTDNGLIKTVATLPTNATILDAAMVTSEVFDSDDEKGMDLVMTSTSPASADTAITGAVVQLITAFEAKSSANGAVGQGQGLVGNPNFIDGGAGTHLVLINTDGSQYW
jgi:hypothetical protein